jgi:hypothetical protein
MVKLFKGLTPKDHGAFLKWDGARIPFKAGPEYGERLPVLLFDR